LLLLDDEHINIYMHGLYTAYTVRENEEQTRDTHS